VTAVRTLGGILAPSTTPFDARTGELDRPAFERNVDAYVAAGLAGVVVAGSNGEAALLDERERFALVEWARPRVPADRWLLAGAGAESTRGAVYLARGAAERGADAVLVVAPHYYGAAVMTAEALLLHYRRLADESPIPVVLYNIPKYMHYALPTPVVAELARHENVIGIKDSSGDPAILGGYLGCRSDGFAVLTGSAPLLREAMEGGAAGGILAVGMFASALTLAAFAAAQAHADDAAALQARVTPIAKEIVGTLGVPGVKAALDLVGLAGGMPRLPLLPLGHGATMHVRTLLHEAAVPTT